MAPPERFSDTGPLCSQPLHHPSQCQFCSCAFLAGSVKKPGEANSCFNPLTIPLPRYFSFKMPLVFECSQIIVSVERIIISLAAQLVTLSLRLARESIIIRRFLFSVRGKSRDLFFHSDLQRRWKMHFLWCLLCLNTPYSGGGGSHCPGQQVYWLRSSLRRPLLTQFGSWCSPWRLSKRPLWACREGSRSPNKGADREISVFSTHSHSALLLQCVFLFLLRKYFLQVNSTLSLQSESTWITPRVLTSWCSKWSSFLLPPASSVGGSRG